jgi:hypothetical protein
MNEDPAKDEEITSKDIMEAMTLFAERMDSQFVRVHENLAALNRDVGFLKTEVGLLKTAAVSKEYLDEKLSTMYGNSMSMDKKVDKHVDAVVDVLA